jgi:hypothetical protein
VSYGISSTQSVLVIVVPAGEVYAVFAIAANVVESAVLAQFVGQVPVFVQFDAKAGKDVATMRRRQRIDPVSPRFDIPDRLVPCSQLTQRVVELRAAADPETCARCHW